MKIRRIEAEGFMAYSRPFELDLPDAGLVLITGPNGSGKSSIVEMVAAAAWGKTLRGAPFWRRGEECRVKVLAEEGGAERSVTRAEKKSVRVFGPRSGGGGELPAAATATKAQVEIDALLGEQEAWRRTSVFTSREADAFALATDAERKRLVEQILGLTVFDAALRGTRDDLARERNREASASKAIETSERALSVARRGADLVDPDELDPSPWWFEARRSRWIARTFDDRVKAARAEADLAETRRRRAEESLASVRRDLAHAVERSRLLSSGRCPTCAQAVGAALELDLSSSLANARRAVEVAVEEAAEGGRLVDAKRGEHVALAGERAHFEVEADALAGFARSVEARRSRELRAAEEAAALAAEVATLEEGARAARADVVDARRRVELLSILEKIFGLRGARSRMLGDLVGAIAGRAGELFARLLPGARVSGSIGSDGAIDLSVEGVGGGWGYEAMSSGERRRHDVPLLLALAEAADASTGRAPGTLFFDEVLDSLDREGVASVLDVLVEMASRRTVVLISHNEELVAGLRAHVAREVKLG